MLVRCVHCDTDLVAPVRSEYWSDNHACHIWHCPKCCACFSSLVSFSDDTATPRYQLDFVHGGQIQHRVISGWR
jgi:hypothetical protein